MKSTLQRGVKSADRIYGFIFDVVSSAVIQTVDDAFVCATALVPFTLTDLCPLWVGGV